MELDVKGRITDKPTPDDIIRAVAQAGDEAEGYINLSDDDGYVEAFRTDDGSFRLVRHDGTTKFDAADPVDAEALKAILVAYLRGEKGWRKDRVWLRAETPSQAAATSGQPPAWAIAAVVASVAFIVLVTSLPGAWLPSFLGTTPGIIGLFALPVVVMIGAMIANVAIKMNRAKSWLQAEGRVTRSKLAMRRPPAGNEIGTAVNVPDVAYTFSVGGQGYQGKRVSLGDISGKFAEEAVRRYAVGSAVMVYYDPADPANCVLERGLVSAPAAAIGAGPQGSDSQGSGSRSPTDAAPKVAATGCAIGLAVLALLGAGGYWLATGGVQELETRMPRAEVPVMLCAIGFGLLTLLFFVGYRRYLMRANTWPVAPGRVTISRVEERRSSDDGRTRRVYAAVVEFRYEVGGLGFSSRQISLGLEMSGSRSAADKVVGRYRVGATVEVHYDPANPSQAALENPTGTNWLLFGVALFCFGVAVYASHIFR